jgi:hypothetical protein
MIETSDDPNSMSYEIYQEATPEFQLDSIATAVRLGNVDIEVDDEVADRRS